MRKASLYLILFTLLACTKDAQIPAYITIDAYDVSVQSFQGSNSSNIKDTWIFVDNKLQEVEPLKTKIPVFSSGNTKLSIQAGINISGQSNLKGPYPFYESFDTTINVITNQHYVLKPIWKYKTNISFKGINDFEGNLNFEKLNGSDTNLIQLTTSPFEGNASGALYLDSNQSKIYVSTKFGIPYQTSLNSVFLELDYKNSYPFNIGILATNNEINLKTPVLSNIFAKDDWNKIYIDLTQALQLVPNNVVFEVYFEMDKASNESAFLLLDNLKILTK